MPSSEEIDEYIKLNKVFSIPQLQENFKIGYWSVKRHVERLIKDGKIEYCDGIFYRNIETSKAEAESVKVLHTDDETLYERFTGDRHSRSVSEERRSLFLRSDDISKTFENDFERYVSEIEEDEFFFNSYNLLGLWESEYLLWEDAEEFSKTVVLRFARLVRSDYKMARGGAIKKAQLYLQAVKDTSDIKKVQVYERLVDILKAMSNYSYNQKRMQLKNISY